MSTITLNNITSGYNVNKINDNFTTLTNSVNNDIIHSSGGQNVMGQDLDFNSHSLLNVGIVNAQTVRINGLPITTSQFVLGANVVGDTNISLSGISSSKVNFLQGGTGAVSRTIQNKELEVVSPEDFGAVGDGTTDDKAALLAMSTYILSLPNGGMMRFGRGKTYAVGSQWTIPKTGSKQVIIDGCGSMIKNLPSYDGIMIYYGEPTGVGAGFPLRIYNLTFQGTTTNATGLSLEWAGTSEISCTFQNCRQGALMSNCYAMKFFKSQFLYCSFAGIYTSTIAHNLILDQCGSYNNPSTVHFGPTATAYNLTIMNCDIEGGVNAIILENGGYCVNLIGNYFEGQSANPFVFSVAAGAVTVRGNWIGYGTGTVDWSNIDGGSLTGNIIWNQASTIGSAKNFDIGANQWAGTSNQIYTPWQTITLSAGYTAVAGQPVPSFRRDSTGLVHLKGNVTGAADGVIVQLPAGYRPNEARYFLGRSPTGAATETASVNVSGGGNVTIYRGASTNVCLDQMHFLANG